MGKCNPVGTVLLIERNIPADPYFFPNSLLYIYPLMIVLVFYLVAKAQDDNYVAQVHKHILFYFLC